MDKRQQIADKIVMYYGASPKRNGECELIECPFCGDSRKKCSLSVTKYAFNCFICGGHSIFALAKQIGISTDTNVKSLPKPVPVEEKPFVDWMSAADEWVEFYMSDDAVIERWQAYKPVDSGMIVTHRLGYGALPGQKTARLIVPQRSFDGSKIVGLHGRIPPGIESKAKWICAEGSSKDAWGMHRINDGDIVIICENYVDCILHEQRAVQGDGVAIALGSARRMTIPEMKFLKSKKPRLVVVMLDNDIAGQANDELFLKLYSEWVCEFREKHPDLPIPKRQRFGKILFNDLTAFGLKAELFSWSADAPAKADLGWVMINNR